MSRRSVSSNLTEKTWLIDWGLLAEVINKHSEVFCAYMSVLNLERLCLSTSGTEKWTALINLMAHFHATHDHSQAAIDYIHGYIKTLRDCSVNIHQSADILKVTKMLKHPTLVQAWARVLQSPAFRSGVKITTLKTLATYDPTVSL